MRVQVKLYASLRKFRPELDHGEAFELELEEGTTWQALIVTLGIPETEAKQCFVNGIVQRSNRALEDGDEIGLFPPIAGG
jgi:molybdopterin converting factor small subunit